MLGVIVPLSFLGQCNYQWSMELHLIYLSASHTDTYILYICIYERNETNDYRLPNLLDFFAGSTRKWTDRGQFTSPACVLCLFSGHLLIALQMRVLISSLCDFIMDYIRINVPHLPSPVSC